MALTVMKEGTENKEPISLITLKSENYFLDTCHVSFKMDNPSY